MLTVWCACYPRRDSNKLLHALADACVQDTCDAASMDGHPSGAAAYALEGPDGSRGWGAGRVAMVRQRCRSCRKLQSWFVHLSGEFGEI